MKMPDVATNDSLIRIVRWLVRPGDRLQQGQPLVEVETDKATLEVESAVAGTLKELRCSANDEVAAQQVIAVFDVEAREVPGLVGAAPPSAAGREQGRSPEAARSPDRSPAGSKGGGMFARNRTALAGQRPADRIALTPAQLTAGKRLQMSKQTVPHFYLQSSANVSSIAAHIRESGRELVWDAFFVQSVARALLHFERFRCRLEGEHLVHAESDAVGVAVDHDGELYVIPIAAALTKSLAGISAEIRQGAERVRSGDPDARRLRPAQITITNLGVCNVESFLPIINPPEVAILGVGKAKPTPVVQEGGRVGVEQRCTLTLSVDHRVASGKYAGDFLSDIIRELETAGP